MFDATYIWFSGSCMAHTQSVRRPTFADSLLDHYERHHQDWSGKLPTSSIQSIMGLPLVRDFYEGLLNSPQAILLLMSVLNVLNLIWYVSKTYFLVIRNERHGIIFLENAWHKGAFQTWFAGMTLFRYRLGLQQDKPVLSMPYEMWRTFVGQKDIPVTKIVSSSLRSLSDRSAQSGRVMRITF